MLSLRVIAAYSDCLIGVSRTPNPSLMAHVSPEVLTLLERDISRTVGDRYRHRVREAAANVETLDIADGDEKLIEDVQQVLHDEFVDTSWPRCPRHHRHPLWYRDGGWWCETDRVFIARLGNLGRTSRPAG